jgi:hypothetical protein
MGANTTTGTAVSRDAHYFTDNAISFAARKEGIDVGVHRDYSFVHHLADVGRGAGTTWHNRMQEDHVLFSQWVRSLEPGHPHMFC